MPLSRLAFPLLALVAALGLTLVSHRAPAHAESGAARVGTLAPIAAQDEKDSEELPPEAAEPKKSEWDLVLPFELDGLMFTTVSINDDETPFRFLIDSGASSSVLAKRTADLLGIEGTAAPMQARGVGKQDVSITMDVKLTTGDHSWTAKMAIITDLSKIADMSGRYMDGILGADWMMQWGINEYDFMLKQARFKKPEKGKGKRSMQDMMAGAMRMFGNRRLPGQPEPKEGDKPEDGGKRRGENHSHRPLDITDLWLASVQISLATLPHRVAASMTAAAQSEAQPAPFELTSLEVPFTMGEARLPGIGSLVLVALWFVDMEIDGKPATMIYDTGASALLVLDRAFADSIDLGTSFTFPVTGLGEASASMGLVQDFSMSGHRERGDNPAVILDLSETFAQFDQLGDMLKQFGMGSAINLPKPVGLGGLPFAMRYRTMRVDFGSMRLTFTRYSDEDLKALGTDALDPRTHDATVITAVKKTWDGKGGALGLDAHSLKFETWKDYGLDGGLVIDATHDDGAAAKAGLKRGDILAMIRVADVPGYDAALTEATGKAGGAGRKQLQDGFAPIRAMSEASIIAALVGGGKPLTFRVWSPDLDDKGDPIIAEDGKRAGKLRDVKLTLDTITDGVRLPERLQPKPDTPSTDE